MTIEPFLRTKKHSINDGADFRRASFNPWRQAPESFIVNLPLILAKRSMVRENILGPGQKRSTSQTAVFSYFYINKLSDHRRWKYGTTEIIEKLGQKNIVKSRLYDIVKDRKHTPDKWRTFSQVFPYSAP